MVKIAIDRICLPSLAALWASRRASPEDCFKSIIPLARVCVVNIERTDAEVHNYVLGAHLETRTYHL